MAFIKIIYGPYEAHGVIRHKLQRLRGAIRCLTQLGYEIEMVPSPHLNRVTVVMKGREVFRCDINHLQFGFECKDDYVCQKLVDAVEDANFRLHGKRNIPSYEYLLRGKRVIEESKIVKTAAELLSPSIQLWFEIPKNRSSVYSIKKGKGKG